MTYLKELLGHNNELLLLALLIITGLFFSETVKKFHLPRITGYILAGMILGKPVLGLVSPESIEKLSGINLLALGLMSITIGAHLDFHKLKNSWKRVMAVSVGETSGAFLLVFLAVYYIANQGIVVSILIASMSISTSPAAIVAVVKDTRSRGTFVNTLMPVVAINNILAITAFGLLSARIALNTANNSDIIFSLEKELLLPIIIGLVAGFLLKYFSEKNIASDRHVLTMVFLTVAVTTGIARIISLNVMFPNMVVGLFIINTSQHRQRILTIFEEIEYIIVIIFFTLAGAHMEFSGLAKAGILLPLYCLSRSAGKIVGASTGAWLIKTPARIYKYIGIALIPQAAVIIGLVMMARNIPGLGASIDLNFITTFVLATVVINEIAGPLMAKWALHKSGDADMDRPKLIEFIQEEYIKPNLKATTKEGALRELTRFLIDSHKGSKDLEKEIIKSVLKRESEASTGIGDGMAIPHGIISEGPVIWGAIGLSRTGIEYESIDGGRVHLIILIVTPNNHKADMHLAVLGEISKLLSTEVIREKLFKSKTAWEICEILRAQEYKGFNYFLE